MVRTKGSGFFIWRLLGYCIYLIFASIISFAEGCHCSISLATTRPVAPTTNIFMYTPLSNIISYILAKN